MVWWASQAENINNSSLALFLVTSFGVSAVSPWQLPPLRAREGHDSPLEGSRKWLRRAVWGNLRLHNVLSQLSASHCCAASPPGGAQWGLQGLKQIQWIHWCSISTHILICNVAVFLLLHRSQEHIIVKSIWSSTAVDRFSYAYITFIWIVLKVF